MGPNWYDVLGIAESASRQEIRRAYLHFIRRTHPDRNPRPDAAARAARLNEAYEVLSDPEKRAALDARLKAQRALNASPVPADPATSARHAPAGTWNPWTNAGTVGALGVCALLACIVYAAATPPAGNAAPDVPAAGAAMNAARDAVPSPARARVQVLIDRLARTDGSALTPREVSDIAAGIRQELDASPEADGFIARAYFNVRLLATGVEVLARVDRGEAIAEQIADVRDLNDVAAVRTWLTASGRAASYNDLVDRVTTLGGQYAPGRPAAELDADLKSKDDLRERLRAQMDADRLAGRVDAFNSRAAVYNQLVEETNAMAAVLVARSTLAGNLADAFNRVLDPSIIHGANRPVSR